LKYAGIALLLMLAGCVSVPSGPDVVRRELERTQYLAEHTNWTFSGRMAYSHEGKGGSAQMQWQQNGDVSDLRINAPLAMGSVRIRFDADTAQIFDASGRELRSGKPDVLLAELLQAPIPTGDLVSGLRAFWPESPEQTASAELGAVTLADWSWNYTNWRAEPVRLPGKIEIQRGQTRLRIIIDQWRDLPDG
jgi:outer membrane lipoprotein LolB